MPSRRSDKPRIAHIVHSLKPGGAERLVVDLCLNLHGDFDIEVFCLDEPGDWAKVLREADIPVICLWRDPGIDLGLISRLRRELRRLRADIVHAHQCTPWFYAALARLFGASGRLLLHEHGRNHAETLSRRRVLMNKAIINRQTSAVIAVSTDLVSRLETFEGVPANRISVVRNGIGALGVLGSAERSALRASLNLAPTDFVIGSIGRLDPIKNFPLLINAASKLLAHIPSLKVVLVGSGPEEVHLKALIRRAELGDATAMLGFRNDARDIVQCLDAFVLPSHSEGISVALLEAMALGVPCIATGVGGNPEVIDSAEAGWLIEDDNLDQLVASVLDVFHDVEQRNQVIECAKLRVRTSFSSANMHANIRDIYATLLTD